jgi:hypothetical protein
MKPSRVSRMFSQNCPVSPTSRKTPSGGRMMAATSLMISDPVSGIVSNLSRNTVKSDAVLQLHDGS